MPPRPRKHIDSAGSNSMDRQAEAAATITPQWLAELLKYKVFGESKRQPSGESIEHLAGYLRFAATLHKSQRPIAQRDEAATRTRESISFLRDVLPGFRADAVDNAKALEGWEKYHHVTEDDEALRKSMLTSTVAEIEKIDGAIEALKHLDGLGVLSVYQAGVLRPMNTWHDYAYPVALVFIDMMRESQGAIAMSLTGPVARFMWHIIPSLSEERAEMGTVGRFLSAKASEAKAG